MLRKILECDQEIFLFLNSKHNTFLDPLMLFASSSISWIIGGLLMIALLYIYGNEWKKTAPLFFILSVSTSAALTNIIKVIIERPRPIHNVAWANSIHAIEEYESSYSFFSSHAATTFSMAVFIFLFFRKTNYSFYGYIAIAWAAIISYSRIYLAKHYPLDVAIGIVFGSLIAIVTYKLFESYQKKNSLI